MTDPKNEPTGGREMEADLLSNHASRGVDLLEEVAKFRMPGDGSRHLVHSFASPHPDIKPRRGGTDGLY